MSEPPKPAFEFGPLSLDPGKRLPLRNGAAVQLAPKVLETLLALVEHRDRVLSKDELLDQVWGGVSVEEGGLTRNVLDSNQQPPVNRRTVCYPVGATLAASLASRRAEIALNTANFACAIDAMA